ncbi:MAG: cytochrome P450, partial [Chloroflexi bacterium]|nr:cytochrome P450 [Chloroflexota bacterium]
MATPSSPPGPGVRPTLKHVRPFVKNRAEFLLNLWKEYGDIARFRLGLYDIYFVNRPEWVREVLMNHDEFQKTPAMQFLRIVLGKGLLLSQGEFHHRQRRLMQPAFHGKRIALYCDTMAVIARTHAEGWHDGAEVDIHDKMIALTLEIVAKFSVTAEAELEENLF